MSVLVGDIIMSVRSIPPDMPGVVAPPALPTIAVVAAASSTLLAGTYFLRFSYTTPWGESSAGTESAQQTVGAGQGINIVAIVPVGVATLRAYFGSQGAENQFVDLYPGAGGAVNITISTPGAPGIVPNINRAYLPDTDGAVFPAITLYGWLRDGLKAMGNLVGGIYDATGINTTKAVAMYALLGDWRRFSHSWVDGWPFDLGNKGEIFYRNKVTTSGSGIAVTDTQGPRSIVEYYPVPDRTGGQTTTTANIAGSAVAVPCVSLSGFLLQYGLAMLGNPVVTSPESCEIIAYQFLNGNSLTSCLRGLGGTYQTSWPEGTPVLELNGRFAGYRYPRLPRVGDASRTLDVPPGWDVTLQLYMESRYREFERRFSDAKALRDAFAAECKTQKASNAGLLGPKQVGDIMVTEVYNAGLGGGWLLP